MDEQNIHRPGDRAVRHWIIWSVIWFPLFALFGFTLALKFFQPEFLTGAAWTTFGRVRPAHVNGVTFGFLSSALVAAMFYILPRLCRAPLRHAGLAKALAWLWNLAVVAGTLLLLGGHSQGREYAEFPWIVDVAVLAVLLLMAWVVFGTLKWREERKLYVSTWYYAGTMLWFPVVYLIGNVMWKVPGGALSGTTDAIFNWYYGHNVLGLWFTTLGIPVWYFVIPRGVNRPLYSHLLSLIAFFSIAFFYTGVGGHHILQAPIPEWLKTVAVAMSILMFVPVLAFATNILLTMRGAAARLVHDLPLRFMTTGFFFYILVSFQGSLQSFRSTNAYTHFSQWPVGHAHLALLGGFGFLGIGVAHWLANELTGRKAFSDSLTKGSYWILTVGFLTFFTGMTVAGLVANSAWWIHMGIAPTLPMLRVHFIVRAVGGGMVVLGAILFSFNVLLTFLKATEAHEFSAHPELEKTASERKPSRFMRHSQENINLPVIVFGGLVVFTLMTFMVVAMPYMGRPTLPTERAHPLEGLEAQGKDLYRSLGCFYCHNQFVRPQDWAMGAQVSRRGDFFFTSPHFLGTERTGPNLAQVGGMRPTRWHHVHDRHPRQVSPASIMPEFPFLTDPQVDALVAYVQNLGSKDLEPRHYQPVVPLDYRGRENPYMGLMMAASKAYDAASQVYTGDPEKGSDFARVFEEGKAAYTQKCLPCHGCSGNGEGPYARQTLTRPADLNERIARYPGDDFHFWRVSEGVPGTHMPPWGRSLKEDLIWRINTFEMSFLGGAVRTVAGDISDKEGIAFADRTGIAPPIAGTREDFEQGRALYALYCAQCHGEKGDGKGPAAYGEPGGYIRPEPAVFPETGHDFTRYGQYVWKVREGVPTTNMPPWREALSDEEIYAVIFYIQRFADPVDYYAKWAPLYRDHFAGTLDQGGPP